MKHGSKFLATLLSITLLGTSILPGATVPVSADEAKEQSNSVPMSEEEQISETIYDEITAESAEGSYTVTFDANGGYFGEKEAPITTQQSISDGEPIYTYSYMPFREDKIFKGWSRTADGDVEFNAQNAYYNEQEDLTLFAVWADASIITFHSDNEIGIPLNSSWDGESRFLNSEYTDEANQLYKYASFLIENGVVLHNYRYYDKNSNRSLVGWKEKDADEVYISDGYTQITQTIDRNLDLYPVWETGYKVTFSVPEGAKLKDSNCRFSGSDYSMDPIDSDLELDPEAEDNYKYGTYTTFFKTGTGKVDLLSSSYVVPTDEEQVFLGWSRDESGSQVIQPGTLISINEDTHFYAVFGKGIKVNFDANGGKINGKDVYAKAFTEGFESNPETGVDQPVWKDSSKIFCGWSRVKDDENQIADYTWSPTEGETLYALWKNAATVHIYVPDGQFKIDNSYVSEFDYRGPEGNVLQLDINPWNDTVWWDLRTDYGFNKTIMEIVSPTGMIADGFHVGSLDGEVEKQPTLVDGEKLYINWAEGCRITFDYNGGVVNDTNSADYSQVIKKFEVPMVKGTQYCELGLINDYSYRTVLEAPEGMAFAGWTTEKDNRDTLIRYPESKKDITDQTTLQKDTTLYAYWIKVSSITYDANGGFFDGDEEKTIITDDVENEKYLNYIDPPQILDDSKVFGGWSLSKDGKIIDIDNIKADGSSVTYYAIWVPAVTVELRANGGYFRYSDKAILYTIKVAKGKEIGRYIDNPVYDGKKIFDGWDMFKKADGSDAVCVNDERLSSWQLYHQRVDEDLILVANWADAVNITWNGNKKGYYPEEVYDENLEEYVDSETSTELKKKGDLIYDGNSGNLQSRTDDYILNGWSLNPDGRMINFDNGVLADKDLVFYAQWAAAAEIKIHTNGYGYYKVSERAEDGDWYTHVTDCAIQKGKVGGLLYDWIDEPSRKIDENGKKVKNIDKSIRFAGWSLSPNGEILDDDTKITGDMELYAIWKKTKEVSYYANGGTLKTYRFRNRDDAYGNRDDAYGYGYIYGNGESTKDTYFEDETLPTDLEWYVDKDNYGFNGWTTTIGSDAKPINNAYTMGNSDVLYANWTEDYYTLTLKLGNYNCGSNRIIAAPEDQQEIQIRLAKNTSLKQYLEACKAMDFDGNDRGEVVKDSDGNMLIMPFKGFSEKAEGGLLIDTDASVLNRDVTLYAIYEKLAQNEALKQIDKEIPQTAEATTKKADSLIETAQNVQKVAKKTMQDIIGSTDVMVKAINDVKDQTVINSLKDVLISVMDEAKKDQATVEAVQLFDLEATGAGKVLIYVGKDFAGQLAVIGHYHGGEWTLQQCKVDRNGYINPQFESFSPISISILSKTVTEPIVIDVKDEGDKTVIPPVNNNNNNNNNKPKENVPKQTPKQTPSPVTKTDINALTITLSKEVITYNGKNQKPTVTIKTTAGKALTAGTDYDAVIAEGRKVGNYEVKVTGKGNYIGTKTIIWQIVPKNAGKLKVKANGTKIKVSWKKQVKETTGYEIQYANNKNFKKAKKQTVKRNKTQSVLLKKGIKKKKTYYVRIRSYKTVSGKKIYSDWSKTKKVKIK